MPPVAAPESPAPPALAPEAEKAARQALQLLWSGKTREFHQQMLLVARQKDTRVEDIQNALVENLTEPLGGIREVQRVSREDFEIPQDLPTVGINPSPETGQLEMDRYGSNLLESYWRIKAARGEVLASIMLVPEEGQFRVQTILLRAQRLGRLLVREVPEDHQALVRLLGLVQAGNARQIHKVMASPGLRQSLALEALTEGVEELRAALPAGRAAPSFREAWRWYSSEGWARTCNYRLPGRQKDLDLSVTWLEKGGFLTGLNWNYAGQAQDTTP